jgi:hypothetical protein
MGIPLHQAVVEDIPVAVGTAVAAEGTAGGERRCQVRDFRFAICDL